MTELHQLARVAVVGTSCSGKTTFARRLATLLRVPHVEFDSHYWGPDWTPVPAEGFREWVDQATAEEQWICDGNYHVVRDLVWPRATAVVWLNFSFPVVFSRAVRRTFGRCLTRRPAHGGNRETFAGALLSRDSILLWVLRTYRAYRREYPRLLAEPRHRHLHVYELDSSRAAERLLEKVAVAADGATVDRDFPSQ